MLISQERKSITINNALELGEDISVEAKGKGRKFVSRFIEAGLAHYAEFGDILITKETIDKFIMSMVGCPVIIKHKDITDKNVDKERIGVVSSVWYNQTDGWFYAEGIIWDKQAIDLVKNQGWNVSCTYDFESNFKKGTYHGKPYDMEFTGGEFLHLALVNNPRYERANIVMNSKDEKICYTVENEKWITIHPHGDSEDEDGKKDYRRIKLEDGETPKEAIERTYGKIEENKQKETEKIKKYEENQEKNKQKAQTETLDEYLDRMGVKSKKGSVYELHKYDWEQAQKETKDITKEEHAKIAEKVSKMSDDELIKARSEAQKGYENEKTKAGVLSKHEATYGIIAQELKKRTGKGFGQSASEQEIKDALKENKQPEQLKLNLKAENMKGKLTMSVLNELECFIKNIVDNACKKEIEEETIVENEEKDYKKLYEDLKAQCEAKNADEKEEKFEEEKEIAENKEDLADDKDEEVEELEKEEVKNKCAKNSEDEAENSMDEMKKAVYGTSQDKVEKSYLSQDERVELGNQY